MWRGINFEPNWYHKCNRILVKVCTDFYYQCWIHQNNYLHNYNLLFNSRQDLCTGCKIIYDRMAKWGLTVHIGYGTKKSKTEVMLFPSMRKLKEWRTMHAEVMDGREYTCTSSSTLTKRVVLIINLESKYREAEETRDIIVNANRGKFKFTITFVYLGITLTFLLDDTVNVKCRISKALKAIGALKSIWEAKEVPLTAKRKLYKLIPVNLML